MTIKEINVGTHKVYEVSFDSNDEELLEKIINFALTSSVNTYRRSGMKDDEHIKNIIIGKRAEEACMFLLEKHFNLKFKYGINYNGQIDSGDLFINNKSIDVKSSSLKTKSRTYSLEDALKYFNFTVLLDQSFKDIIIQAFYKNRNEFDRFYFSKWQYVSEVLKNGKTKFIKMNGNSGNYKLLPLNNGRDLVELINVLRNEH